MWPLLFELGNKKSTREQEGKDGARNEERTCWKDLGGLRDDAIVNTPQRDREKERETERERDRKRDRQKERQTSVCV